MVAVSDGRHPLGDRLLPLAVSIGETAISTATGRKPAKKGRRRPRARAVSGLCATAAGA